MKNNEDFEPYQPNNVPLFEAIYGKSLISLGGISAIDNMFLGLNITGLSALDIGFGLGGVAYYLADHYQMKITGIEIHSWMVDYAIKHSPSNIAHRLKFSVYTPNEKLSFDHESFDLAYSKGVMNHVKDKTSLFTKIFSVLKPKALFVIADWIYPQDAYSLDGSLVKETKESYQTILKDAGFKQVNFRDDSEIFMSFVNTLIDNVTQKKIWISNNYSEDVYLTILEDHHNLVREIKNKKKFAVRIVAIK